MTEGEKLYNEALELAKNDDVDSQNMSEKYILKACVANFPKAVTHWGDIQLNNDGLYSAFFTYKDAAELGDPRGMYCYGKLCLKDIDGGEHLSPIKRDTEKSEEWIKKSAIAGYKFGQYEWAEILNSKYNNLAAATVYFDKAFAQ